MTRPDWSPHDIDIDKPSAARIYDYLLGGSHNFAADRHYVEQAIAIIPDLRTQARANRAFLYRAVRYLTAGGVRQFLDIGSGIPTSGNVHEVAQRYARDAICCYVDIDPVAIAHSRAMLGDTDRVRVIQADLRNPDEILADPDLTILDLKQPVGLLLVAILHAIPDADDPGAIVARLRDVLAPGSCLVIAHGTADSRTAEILRLRDLSKRSTPTAMTLRSRDQVTQFFSGWDLVDPGLVWAPEWRPDIDDDVEHPELSGNYVGVARKP